MLHDFDAPIPGSWVGEKIPGPAGVVGFYGKWQSVRC